MALSSSSSFSGIDLGNNPFTNLPPQTAQDKIIAGSYGFSLPSTANPNLAQNQGILNSAQGFAGMAANQGQQGIMQANALGGGVQSTANNLQSMGTGISNEFAGNAAYANQALQDAFDPMQNQMKSGLATTMDSTNALLANSGLASTPYGASVGAGAAGNFVNNWQTAQIQRENTGASTATGLQGQELQAQQTGGELIDQAGQLNLGAMNSILSQYGLSEQGAADAARSLATIFGDLSTSRSVSGSVS